MAVIITAATAKSSTTIQRRLRTDSKPQAHRPGVREATIATATPPPGSLQRMLPKGAAEVFAVAQPSPHPLLLGVCVPTREREPTRMGRRRVRECPARES